MKGIKRKKLALSMIPWKCETFFLLHLYLNKACRLLCSRVEGGWARFVDLDDLGAFEVAKKE